MIIKTRLMFISLEIIGLLVMVGCFIEKPQDLKAVSPEENGQHALDSMLTPISTIEYLLQRQTSDITVTVKGVITRILSDDTVGDRHQRFIIKLSNSQTLLIVHNIDIAPRVAGISVNSEVYVHGEYVWNSEGGLVHWTHLDPGGVHDSGWIVFAGKKYQ